MKPWLVKIYQRHMSESFASDMPDILLVNSYVSQAQFLPAACELALKPSCVLASGFPTFFEVINHAGLTFSLGKVRSELYLMAGDSFDPKKFTISTITEEASIATLD